MHIVKIAPDMDHPLTKKLEQLARYTYSMNNNMWIFTSNAEAKKAKIKNDYNELKKIVNTEFRKEFPMYADNEVKLSLELVQDMHTGRNTQRNVFIVVVPCLA